MRKAAGLIVGVAIAIGLIATVQLLGHAVYPPPTNVDFSNEDDARRMLATAPPGSLLFVVGAYVTGVFGGGLIAGLIARETPALFAWAVGGFVLTGAIVNMYAIPHPLWFMIVTVVGIVAAAYATDRAASRLYAATLREPGPT